jgi:hypothetical protein
VDQPTHPEPGEIFRRCAELLAPSVETWQKLVREHVPSESGHCAAPKCGRPGYGTPDYVKHPCGARALADAAKRLHR